MTSTNRSISPDLHIDGFYEVPDPAQPSNLQPPPNSQNQQSSPDTTPPHTPALSETPTKQLQLEPYVSPHLRSHLRQTQCATSSPQRTSQQRTTGTWTSTKFHDANLYASAFMAQLSEPLTVAEALSSDQAQHWKIATDTE